MTLWTLIAGAVALGLAGLAAGRWRRRALPVVVAAWGAVGAGLGEMGGQIGLEPFRGALAVILAFVCALLAHLVLSRALDRAAESTAMARWRFSRAESGARSGELAAALAHEIKNPLTPIRGYSTLLLRELGAVGEAERPLFEKGLGIIDAEAARIEQRVMRALSRARSAVPEPVDLDTLVEEVAGVVEVDGGVTRVDVRLPTRLPRVRAYEDGLQGALVNLLENSAEAMRERPGPIEIEGRHDGEMVRLIIRDRGPGLGTHDVGQLSKAFFTTKETGTGLGLAVARSAIESIGGELDLRDRSDGQGAEATLQLPVWR